MEYDGIDYRLSTLTGDAWINNMQLSPGATVPDCAVIALGGPTRRPNERVFITMDVSHPEVVL